MDYIYHKAEELARKFDTRDPYELLQCISARLLYFENIKTDELKGYATIIKRQKFVAVNQNLNRHDQRIVAGHEAAHLILHKQEILCSTCKAINDFDMYNDSGRLEYQANLFLANFLVSDAQVLSAIANTEDDYFRTARELYFPPPLLAFKLHGMMRRGLSVRPPIDLNSIFLRN
jgi:Zn-dependent peptidase ImmA (M78 family)